jgi:Mg-dependent DNase
MIIDSHCHLDYEPMYSNLDNVCKRAKDSNVKIM